MKSTLKNLWIFLGLALVQGLVLYFNSSNILFWDSVQFAGKHSSYFYANGLHGGILLPDAIDSGHPPSFALYLCAIWTFFGKSLAVSHWAMYPFLIGILYQSFKIGAYAIHKLAWIFPLLVVLCPFYLGHSILVSPDLILLFGFLLMLRGHLLKQRVWLGIGTLILSIISLRGMALLFSFFLYDLYTDRQFSFKSIIKMGLQKVLIYLPAVSIALSYLIYHYMAKGWVSHHPDSPWSNSYAHVDIYGFLKNVLFMGHRILDFGMFFIYAILIWKFRYLALLKGRLIWLWLFILLVMSFLVLPYVGLLNHRYFLPLQIIAILMASQLMMAINKKYLIAIVTLGLGFGNFWIYPDSISQGWDSSYAHQPFYGELDKLKAYIDEQGISSSSICTVFPLKGEQRFLTLDDTDLQTFGDYHNDSCSYILYSNIMNDYTDEDMAELHLKKIVYQSETRGVTIILYK